jgi:hypothetical protein
LVAAALGRGAEYREVVAKWIEDGPDEPEESRVLAARCMRLALDGGAEDLAWVRKAGKLVPCWVLEDLAHTRLPGAVAPALGIATEIVQTKRPAEWQDILARAASLLPLEAKDREAWEQLIGRPIPAPAPSSCDRNDWRFVAHPPAPGL